MNNYIFIKTVDKIDIDQIIQLYRVHNNKKNSSDTSFLQYLQR